MTKRLPKFLKFILLSFSLAILILVVGIYFWFGGNFPWQAKAGTSDNVSGFAWSENIGWIKFNNCTDPSNPATCGPTNYGVNIDPLTGVFSGYAWAGGGVDADGVTLRPTIGWIRFDPNGPYPGSPNYSACLDLPGAGQACDGVGNFNVSGWARAKAGAIDQAVETFSVTSNPSGGDDVPRSMAADSQFLYLAGHDNSPGNSQWRIEKRDKKSGGLVSAFGNGGVVQNNISTGDDQTRGIVVDDNFIYIAGYYNGNEWRIEKRDKTNGGLTWEVTERILPKEGSGRSLRMVQDTDFLYLVGSENGIAKWRIEKRRKTDGQPDLGFGTNGMIISDPTPFNDYPQSMAIDGGSIYVGGYQCGGSSCPQWRVEKRSKTNGLFVSAFGSSGVVLSPEPSQGVGDDLYLFDIVVDGSDIFLIGRFEVGGDRWVIEKRNAVNGSLITSFDSDGRVESDPTGYSDYAMAGAVDSDFLYVVGLENELSDAKWRIEKRNKNNGQLITDFGQSGFITINFSALRDWAYDTIIDSAYIYTIGYETPSTGNTQWRIEKRDIVNGGLNWAGATPYPDSSPSAMVFASNPEAGGWDGWIKLRKAPTDVGADYGVILNNSTKEFEKWAWGSDVVGWISFNNKNCDPNEDGNPSDGPAGCQETGRDYSINPIPDYQVKTSLNLPPVKPGIDPLYPDGETWNHCAIQKLSIPTFRWTYTDPDGDSQATTQIKIYGITTLDEERPCPPTCLSYIPSNEWIRDNLNWGATYSWQVRVKDSQGSWSEWSDPNSFTLPSHSYPWPQFTYWPSKPSVDEEVTFFDSSLCYASPGNFEYNCKDGVTTSYQWDFDYPPMTPDSTIKGNTSTTYANRGSYRVRLEITDDLGTCGAEKSIDIALPLPKWKEVIPWF